MFLTGADTPLLPLLVGGGDAGAPTGSRVLQDQTADRTRAADARPSGAISWAKHTLQPEGHNYDVIGTSPTAANVLTKKKTGSA